MASPDLFLNADTIGNGTSLSTGFVLNNVHLVGILMPASWTTAALTFQGSVDGTNFFDLYDQDGAEITVQAAASRMIRLNPNLITGLQAVKIRSGTGAAAVNQGGDRTLVPIAKRYS